MTWGTTGRLLPLGALSADASASAQHVAKIVGASLVVAVMVASIALANSVDRALQPTVAVIGLGIVAWSAFRASGRTKRVRVFIAAGFAAWTASTTTIAANFSIGAISGEMLSVLLLAGVLCAAVGAYVAALHKRMSWRQELAVYLDAVIMAGAATATTLALLQVAGGSSAGMPLAPLLHAVVFLAIVAATLILDLAVLAELRLTGAYAILIGLGMLGLGFVGRSGGFGQDLSPVLAPLVAGGVLVVALGSASWSDRVDARPSYAAIAARLRGWLPLAALAITLLSLFADRQLGGPVSMLGDMSVAVVLAGTVIRQSILLTERQSLLDEAGRRRDQLERRLGSQRQLLAITERLLVHREQRAVFEAVADTLAEVVPHDTLSVYLVDREANCLVPILARDVYAEQILATRPALDAGITGDVIAKGEAEIINDATRDPRVIHVPGTPTDEDEAMIVAPIRNVDGVLGALNIYRTGRKFGADDLELVRLFTNLVAIALENASVHDRLISAATTDPLTNLPNRRLFAERVEQALSRSRASGEHVAVLFLDIDGFKLVNDSLGHAAGDIALRAVAERIRGSVRSSDTVARLGGDEFGLMVVGQHAEADAIEACDRIARGLRDPLALGDRTVTVSASIGVALERGHSRLDGEQLLRDADTAMYLAKQQRRGGFRVFEESMRARQVIRLELEEELRQAITADQLSLAYQPIYQLASGQIVAVEALLRWAHPTRRVDPSDFIELAEQSGLIVALGSWVRREALSQFRRWTSESPLLASRLGLSINISPRELIEEGFVDEVEDLLLQNGVAPARLCLEITEGVMLSDDTFAIGSLNRLRQLGVHVAIDDFGTGYSSLSYLKRLPADGIKIDRSFVEGLGVERERTTIVRATVAFAHALGLTVTAEGVENEEQLRRLREMGCELGQGHFWSPALEPMAIQDLVNTSSVARGGTEDEPASPAA